MSLFLMCVTGIFAWIASLLGDIWGSHCASQSCAYIILSVFGLRLERVCISSHLIAYLLFTSTCLNKVQFSSVQSLSRVQLFATPWIAACQASLSITNSQSSLKLTSIKSVMPSSHLILCCPLLLLPPVPPSIRVFSNESILHMRFSFSISSSNEHPGLISFRMDWLDLLAVQGTHFSRIQLCVILWTVAC